MGELIRSFDWAQTSIGTPDTWPQSLRSYLSLLLNSKFPMLLFWGPELLCFYNDAFRPSLDDNGKHPGILGTKANEAWSEVWDFTGPLVENILAGGGATWFEDQAVPIYRNGHTEDIYWTFSYSPVIDETGHPAGVFVTCTETTKAVTGLQQAQESEARFRTLVEEAPVAMFIFRGEDMVVDTANGLALEMIGRPKNVLGKPLLEVIPELKGSPAYRVFEEVYRTGEPQFGLEALVPLVRNGVLEDRWFNFVYTPYRENGQVVGVMDVATEVTEQVLARQKIEDVVALRTKELAAANLLLAQNNRELEQFAYIASHDLQEPLRKVNTFTQMLKTHLGEVDERSQVYFDKITASTVRMTDLIRDVLDFSQLSNKRQAVEQVDLAKLLEALTADFELVMEQKGAVVHHQNLPTLTANPLQMRQLFGNLLSNALKFTQEGVPPVVSVSSKTLSNEEKATHKDLLAEVDYCLITVADNGIGFGGEYSEKIFGIFQRLHGKAEYEGTGIGLALCKKIAQNHRGEIWATSQPGRGAAFHIILPCPHNAA